MKGYRWSIKRLSKIFSKNFNLFHIGKNFVNSIILPKANIFPVFSYHIKIEKNPTKPREKQPIDHGPGTWCNGFAQAMDDTQKTIVSKFSLQNKIKNLNDGTLCKLYT